MIIRAIQSTSVLLLLAALSIDAAIAYTCDPNALVGYSGPTLPTCSIDPSVRQTVRPEDCGANGDLNNIADDSDAWQAAIYCAYLNPSSSPWHNNPQFFGTVEARTGARYVITKTLVVNTTSGGVIDGRGATLEWRGEDDTIPMWSLQDTHRLEMRDINLTVVADGRGDEGGTKLKTAVLLTNPATTPSGMNWPVAPGQNIFRHVEINGIDSYKLDYGIVFDNNDDYTGGCTGSELCDAGNDQATIEDGNIENVMVAAIKIKGANSHQHHIINTNASGAAENAASFVWVETGYFYVVGGYHASFNNAEYYVQGLGGETTIVNSNSEGCARFIETDSGSADFGLRMNVYNARFAVEGLASDGRVVDWRRKGTLLLDGLYLSGTINLDSNVNPIIYFYPVTGADGEGELEVTHGFYDFSNRDSNTWDPIVLGPKTRVNASGNVCVDGTDGAVTCIGLAGGVTATEGITYTDMTGIMDADGTVSLRNGHSLYCSDCAPHTTPCSGSGTGAYATRLNGMWDCGGGVVGSGDGTVTRDTEWDTAAEINAATTDDDFVTLAGTQTISGVKTFSNEVKSSDGRLTSSVASGSGNVAFDLRPSNLTGSNTDRYLLKLRRGTSTDFLNAREDGLIWTTGGVYTGGITTSLWPTVGNAFFKGYSGVVTSYGNQGLYLQADFTGDSSSSGSIEGSRSIMNWNNSGSASSYPQTSGGRFDNYMGKSSSTLTTQIGGEFNAFVTAASGATVTNQYAGLFYRQYSDNANTTTNGVSLYVASPLKIGSSATITNNYGIQIADQNGLGGTADAALRIDSQTTGSSGAKGNLWLAGGTWSTGHARLENAHVWWDTTANELRVKDSASGPTSEGDGNAVVVGTAATTHGVMLWGVSTATSSSFDTGDEVCAASGMTCVTTFNPNTSTTTACNTAHTHASGYFMAMCK